MPCNSYPKIDSSRVNLQPWLRPGRQLPIDRVFVCTSPLLHYSHERKESTVRESDEVVTRPAVVAVVKM